MRCRSVQSGPARLCAALTAALPAMSVRAVLAQESPSASPDRATEVVELRRQVNDLIGEVQRLGERLERYEAAERVPPPSDLDRRRAEAHRAMVEAELFAAAEQAEQSSGYGEGVDIEYWGWLTYLYQDQRERSTFWAWEFEIDFTKSFTERLAVGADVDLVDRNSGAEVSLEQLFLSAVVSDRHETVLTAGKFNAPFGIEPVDFWDRKTGSRSLLWDALPHDLTGLMVTQPLGRSHVTARGLVVNGFDQNLDLNRQPSFGALLTWEPEPGLRLGAAWFGGPELVAEVGEKQHLVLAQMAIDLGPRTQVEAEYTWGTADVPGGHAHWSGAAAILDVALDERWSVFVRYSVLDDDEGFVTGTPGASQEFGVGLSWWLHPHVELRTEYRRDFGNAGRDENSAFAHLSFGF